MKVYCRCGRQSQCSFSREEYPSLEGDYPKHHFLGISEETESFLRPFALRLFRIALPSAVDILLRNPCLFLRLRLLGWYVLFILHPYFGVDSFYILTILRGKRYIYFL